MRQYGTSASGRRSSAVTEEMPRGFTSPPAFRSL